MKWFITWKLRVLTTILGHSDFLWLYLDELKAHFGGLVKQEQLNQSNTCVPSASFSFTEDIKSTKLSNS